MTAFGLSAFLVQSLFLMWGAAACVVNANIATYLAHVTYFAREFDEFGDVVEGSVPKAVFEFSDCETKTIFLDESVWIQALPMSYQGNQQWMPVGDENNVELQTISLQCFQQYFDMHQLLFVDQGSLPRRLSATGDLCIATTTLEPTTPAPTTAEPTSSAPTSAEPTTSTPSIAATTSGPAACVVNANIATYLAHVTYYAREFDEFGDVKEGSVPKAVFEFSDCETKTIFLYESVWIQALPVSYEGDEQWMPVDDNDVELGTISLQCFQRAFDMNELLFVDQGSLPRRLSAIGDLCIGTPTLEPTSSAPTSTEPTTSTPSIAVTTYISAAASEFESTTVNITDTIAKDSAHETTDPSASDPSSANASLFICSLAITSLFSFFV